MPADWAYTSLTQLSKALSSREVSAVEITTESIARIERLDAKINAVCVRDFDAALQAAKRADEAIARDERQPLLGIPITIKESINVAGLPTTWGIPHHRNFKADKDAVCVARTRAAGAVILGKTNVPLGLGDYQTFNEIYGTTSNPHDLGRSPGGSSGGAAAGLAAGYAPLAIGSDIGGSLRVPAAFCGVYAHKPSYGLAPTIGQTPPGMPSDSGVFDMAVVGPMARSAHDLNILLDTIAGPSEHDIGKAYQLNLPPSRHARISDFRVLVLDTHPLLPVEEDVRTAIGKLAQSLAKCGTSVARESGLLPDLAAAARLFSRMVFATFALGWPPEKRAAMIAKAAKLATGDISLEAERLRGVGMTYQEWMMGNAERDLLKARWRSLFDTFDAVICPVMPTLAPLHDQSRDPYTRTVNISGQPYGLLDQMAWPGTATVAGLPSTALPIDFSTSGLPVGVQIIGPWLEDRTPIMLAQLIEDQFGGFRAPREFSQ